jgi:hypothetical protein
LEDVEEIWRSPEKTGDISGALLTRVIEQEIIPRLFTAHKGVSGATPNRVRVMDIRDIDGFAMLVLNSEPVEMLEQVQALIDQGIALQKIYLDLLAPVARRLGEFWEEDKCTFVDVSIGLPRLQRVLRELSRRNGERVLREAPKSRVYLVQAPGEQNPFNLTMIEELFLQAGWETASDHAASAGTILQTVYQQMFDVIGISLSSEALVDLVCELIRQLRKMSRNPYLSVILCGRLLIDHPELASRIGGAAAISDEVNVLDTAEVLVRHAHRLAVAYR